jgi:hypothetical protein
MTDEEFAVYRDGRYAKAMKYYDDRAITNQRAHRFCSNYVLVMSVAITPILTVGIFSKENATVIAALLAPTVAVVAGISTNYKFHENWLSYRATWDALQHELHWRDARTYEYKGASDRNSLFVERVEQLISQEGSEWLNRHIRKDEGVAR